MEEEGHDPTTFKFELVNTDAKTPAKKTRRSESTIEQEAEETPAMEDMIVQDDAGEDDETESKEKNAEAKMDVDEKTARKREMKDDSEASEPKKVCIDKEVKEEDHKTDNTDAEDSINLDLGEDELLNEEVRFYFFSVTVQLPSKSISNGVSNGMSNNFMMEID